MLAQTPDKYTVGMILRLTEGTLSAVPCAEQDSVECERYADCATYPVWKGLYKVVTEYLDGITGVSLGSNAFFPFGDNIERAHRSGVSYVAEPGGSIRDDNVIETCDKYNMVMAFTKMRLFHH